MHFTIAEFEALDELAAEGIRTLAVNRAMAFDGVMLPKLQPPKLPKSHRAYKEL